MSLLLRDMAPALPLVLVDRTFRKQAGLKAAISLPLHCMLQT